MYLGYGLEMAAILKDKYVPHQAIELCLMRLEKCTLMEQNGFTRILGL